MTVYPINFYDDVYSFFREMELTVEIVQGSTFQTLYLPDLSLYVQCISIQDFQIKKRGLDPLIWQKQYIEQMAGAGEWIRIWEDIWYKHADWNKKYFLYRKMSSKSIFARDLRVMAISKDIANDFLKAEHLLGKVQAKSFLGLVVPPHRQFRNINSPYQVGEHKLVGVAAFAKPMLMKDSGFEGQRSGELIRFCSILGTRIVGGLSKVLQFYQKEEKVDNIMTYIDLEWNKGKGYHSIGFQEIQVTPPILYYLDESGERKLCQSWEDATVCTSGNKKLRLYYSEN